MKRTEFGKKHVPMKRNTAAKVHLESLGGGLQLLGRKSSLFVLGRGSDMFLTRICSDEKDNLHHSRKPPEKPSSERM